MRYLMILLSSVLLMSSALAMGVNHPFSATAIQQLPSQPARQARLFVTPAKVRMEYRSPVGDVVEITDMEDGQTLVLIPQRRIYAQRQAAAAVINQLQQARRPATPCVGQPEAVCNKLGEETLFGRPAEKWEMVVEYQGRSFRSLYWIDTERFMPLRQLLADGTVTELRPVGNEKRGSRDSEKWQLETQRPDGQLHKAEQWYDTELQIMVAEIMPGGYRRELQDIVVAPQDPALFSVPAGYRQVPAQNLSPRSAMQQRHMSR